MKTNIKRELASCKYFGALSDGSTDSSMIEEELVYQLYFKNGEPTVNFLTIETDINKHNKHKYKCIKKAFESYGIDNF